MIEWWGPIVYEYYSGTEDIGSTFITPQEWLAHPGSVGRPLDECHIVGDDGEELPPGEAGVVYFAGGRPFEYHNDPDKTASVTNDQGWRTLGDIGYLDDDGYLYLTDRQAHMIISGGVNIYPQEAENVLASHPAVADVAVIGVPDAEMGEAVKAVVQPTDPADRRAGARGRAARLLPGAAGHLQVPAQRRLRRRAPRATRTASSTSASSASSTGPATTHSSDDVWVAGGAISADDRLRTHACARAAWRCAGPSPQPTRGPQGLQPELTG